jgi:methylenetetrahydrofolate dehydrogenase (NADP+)/methenyltetrahydrofolate cyclohydrolase
VGVACVEHVFPVTVSTKELCAEIAKIREKTDGMVIQLPLPENIDEHKVLSAIPRDKDVDALGRGATACISPVAGAVIEILQQYDIPLRGANVVVIGRGKLVGVPVSTQLAQRGSRVTVLDSTTPPDEFFGLLRNADIVVAGAGVPGLVVPEMLTKGVVLIDAGTSSSGGTIEGDIALACAEKARVFSKTPGGVGPVTVAVLFRNLLQ